MKFKTFLCISVVTLLLISCKNKKEENSSNPTDVPQETIETTEKSEQEISSLKKEEMLTRLQGQWKQQEYPFNTIEFKDTTVKFIEEGAMEAPVFNEYTILNKCPFEVNNIKSTLPEDLFLVLVEDKRCEKISVLNDTLRLRGFSTNTNSEYQIIYKKV